MLFVVVVVVRPHAYDADYCCGCSVVCLFVCLWNTLVSPAKTTKPIEVRFGVGTRVAPRNHVFDGAHTKRRGDSFLPLPLAVVVISHGNVLNRVCLFVCMLAG